MSYQLTLYMTLSAAAGLIWTALAGAGGRNGFPQPHSFIIMAFLTGILFTLPAFAAEYALNEVLPDEGAPIILAIMAGPVEEVSKFAAARFITDRTPTERRLPGSPTAAAAAAAMGLAAVENVAYLIRHGLALAAPSRFLVTPLVHLAWTMVWGRPMKRPERPAWFTMALIAGIGCHSLYNILVTISGYLALPAILLATWYVWREPGAPKPGCRFCAGQSAGITGICPACGQEAAPRNCAQCGLPAHTHPDGTTQCAQGG